MQQAINRSFDILEYLAITPEVPKSFSEIAKSVDLNTGTCANIIKAMIKRGYIEKLDHKKGYLLGRKIYQLASFDGYKKDLVLVAKPYLDQLTARANENVSLAVLKESSRILLAHTVSNNAIQATTVTDKNAYQSSTGRLLVALLADQEIEKHIETYGLPSPNEWKEAATKASFQKEITKIRKDGYCIQESVNQISGISVAVKHQDKVIAALCLYLPSFRLSLLNQQQLIEDLHHTSQQITAGL